MRIPSQYQPEALPVIFWLRFPNSKSCFGAPVCEQFWKIRILGPLLRQKGSLLVLESVQRNEEYGQKQKCPHEPLFWATVGRVFAFGPDFGAFLVISIVALVAPLCYVRQWEVIFVWSVNRVTEVVWPAVTIRYYGHKVMVIANGLLQKKATNIR